VCLESPANCCRQPAYAASSAASGPCVFLNSRRRGRRRRRGGECPVLVLNRCRRGAHDVRSMSGYGHLVCRRSSLSAVCIRIARS
jgi:hypothetical protein